MENEPKNRIYLNQLARLKIFADMRNHEEKTQLQLNKLLLKYEHIRDDSKFALRHNHGLFKPFLKNTFKKINNNLYLPREGTRDYDIAKQLCPHMPEEFILKHHTAYNYDLAECFIEWFDWKYNIVKEFYERRKKEKKETDNKKINDYLKEKVDCICGSTYARRNKAIHCKTVKHISFCVETRKKEVENNDFPVEEEEGNIEKKQNVYIEIVK